MTPTNSWETIIGHERKRQMLDACVNVALEIEASGGMPPLTFERVAAFIADSWMEGYLAENRYTLDDLAGLSWRLGQLTPEQRDEMLAAYRRR